MSFGQTPEEKLAAAIAELSAVTRQTAANLRSINSTSTIYDMVAGKVPCSPIVRITEVPCIACEATPTRKCSVCGDDICEDCRHDHTHGEDWQ